MSLDLPEKIGIFQTAYLGDLVLSIGFVRQVRSKYPKAEITFICRKSFEELLKFVPEIDFVVVDKKDWNSFFMIKRMVFDHFYVLHRSFRTACLTSLNKSRSKFTFKSILSLSQFRIPRSRKNGLHELEKNAAMLGEKNFFLPSFLAPPAKADFEILIAPKSQWPTKEWPFFFELAEKYLKNFKVGWIGIRDLPTSVHGEVLGETLPWGELLGFFSSARGVICNDSSPLHFASAFNKPSLSFWGPTVLDFGYGPSSQTGKDTVIQFQGLPCRPCSIHGGQQCPLGHHRCMRSLTLDNTGVDKEIRRWIASL